MLIKYIYQPFLIDLIVGPCTGICLDNVGVIMCLEDN